MTTEEMKKKLEEKVGGVEVRGYDFIIVHNRKNGVKENFESLGGAYKYHFGYFD